MIADAETLVSWLLWLVMMSSAYAMFIFAVDALLTMWSRRRQVRREARQHAARIEREVATSVRRIREAFTVAQTMVRSDRGSTSGGAR